jgi:hypothetical protein
MRKVARRAKRCHYGSGTADMAKKPVKKVKVKKVLSFTDKLDIQFLLLKAKFNSLLARIKLFAAKLRGY